MQGMKDNFRWTVEAEREVAGAGAGAGIPGKGTRAPQTAEEGGGDFRHRDEGQAAGQADLAAMGVPAEHEAETGFPGRFGDLGAVAEKDPGEAGGTGPGGGLDGAGAEGVGVVNPGEGEAAVPVPEENRLIDEKAEAEGLEPCRQLEGVMVAENGMNPEGRIPEGGEDRLQARKGFSFLGEGNVPEIPGEDGEVERNTGDPRAGHGNKGRIEVEMEVGKVKDPETVQTAGPGGGAMTDTGQAEIEEITVATLVEPRSPEGGGEDPVGGRGEPAGSGFPGMKAFPPRLLDDGAPGNPFRAPAGRPIDRLREGVHEAYPNSPESGGQALRRGEH